MNITHLTRVGEGITRFHKNQKETYHKTIIAYGDSRIKIVKDTDEMFWLTAPREIDNLSSFWNIFDAIKKQAALEEQAAKKGA